jgi:hypothetical protein
MVVHSVCIHVVAEIHTYDYSLVVDQLCCTGSAGETKLHIISVVSGICVVRGILYLFIACNAFYCLRSPFLEKNKSLVK